MSKIYSYTYLYQQLEVGEQIHEGDLAWDENPEIFDPMKAKKTIVKPTPMAWIPQASDWQTYFRLIGIAISGSKSKSESESESEIKQERRLDIDL